MATALMEPDQASLLHADKKYIIQQCESQPSSAEPVTSEGQSVGQQCASCAGLSRFQFLASKMRTSERTAASSTQSLDAAVSQLTRYKTEAVEAGPVGGLDFWSRRQASYSSIQPLAKNLLYAPASQAYVERIISLCGLLTAGRRN